MRQRQAEMSLSDEPRDLETSLASRASPAIRLKNCAKPTDTE